MGRNESEWCTLSMEAQGQIKAKNGPNHRQSSTNARGLVEADLGIPFSETNYRPWKGLPEIRSKDVVPGIDFERWGRVRVVTMPLMRWPPPNKPLPPAPREYQRLVPPVPLKPRRRISAYGDLRNEIKAPRMRRKTMPCSGRDSLDGSADPLDGLANPPLPLPTRRVNSSKVLQIDTSKASTLASRNTPILLTSPMSPDHWNVEFPSFSSKSFPSSPSSEVWQGEPLESGSLISSGAIASPSYRLPRIVDVPSCHVTMVSQGPELELPQYGEMSYISPKLGLEVDAVIKLWQDAGSGSVQVNHLALQRSQTVPTQTKGMKKTKERKVARGERRSAFNDIEFC